MMEKLFLAANNHRGADGTRFAVTRYGNVAGSTGSVIPIWKAMLANGITELPVTHPDATRFWMYAHEAVELVWRTIETMNGGELNIPTLPAYRIADLCEAMGGTPKIIGMRPGEKMHESMSADKRSDKAKIMTVKQLHVALKLV
jgi:UDP-N-acetylglucosamine 4,6-dehydratase